MATEILIKGVPSRTLPGVLPDGQREGVPLRVGRFGTLYVQEEMRKAHLLADEGSYFLAGNAQTGIITAAATAFAATTPSFIIQNNDSPSNPAARRIYLDYIELLITTAGITATATQAKMLALVIDGISRYSSGGTNLTSNIVSPNMDGPARNSVALPYFGNITALAASANARTLAGQRLVRLPVTATTAPDLINDRVRLEFGCVEAVPSVVIGSTGALQANVTQEVIKLPPVVIGPGQSALIYLWQLVAGGTYGTATTYIPEVAWWEK